MLSSRLIIFVIGFLGTIGLQSVGAQPLTRETLLEGLRSIARQSLPIGVGIDIEWVTTTSTRKSRREIDQRIAEIAIYPDHPELRSLQRHYALLKTPEVTHTKVKYADSGAWTLIQTFADGTRFSRAGTRNVRWMLFDAPQGAKQLTLIREGVQFPAGFNVNRYLDITQEQLSMFSLLGVYQLPAKPNTEDIQFRGNKWEARVSQPDGPELRLSGRWDETYGLPIITQLTVVMAENGAIYLTLDCSEHSYEIELNRFVPRYLQLDHSDGIREILSLSGLQIISRREVSDAAEPPEVGDDVAVRDFRSSSAGIPAAYADSNLAIWHRANDRDTYEFEERNVPGSGLNTRVPSATTDGSARWFKYLAALIAIVAFLAVVFRHKWLPT